MPRLLRTRLRLQGAAWTLCLLLLSPGVNALELNQASEAELDSLRGMGPALNRQVRQARDAQPFRDWADFRARVAGVGSHKAQAFSEQGLTINGQSYPR